MLDWLKSTKKGREPAKEEPETVPESLNTGKTAESEAEAALIGRWFSAEAFHQLSEELKKEYLEAESLVSRNEYGLNLDYLYIGRDGHMEFASFACDMTPPSMFEEEFDMTFDPEEAEKLFRVLGIEEDVIARGGEERFFCVFRALMRYVKPGYDSFQLRDEFPALLKQHGIQTADSAECRHLWPGSPFNYEREDAAQGQPLWSPQDRIPAEVGFSAPEETRAYYVYSVIDRKNEKYYLDIRGSGRNGVYQLDPETREWVYDPQKTAIFQWDKPMGYPCFDLPRELPGDTRLDAFLWYAEMLFQPMNAQLWDIDGQIQGDGRTMGTIMPAFLKTGYELAVKLLLGDNRYLNAPDLSEMGKHVAEMNLQSCLQYLLFACRAAAKSGRFRNAWEAGTLLAVVHRAASLHREHLAIRSVEN